jgi:hypothetical protein
VTFFLGTLIVIKARLLRSQDMEVFWKFWLFVRFTVTKKSGSEIKQHTNKLHDLKRSWFSYLLHIDEISDLLPDTSLLVLPDVHSMIRNVQVFYSHKLVEQITQHPSPASHICRNANKYKLLCCRLQTLPESTSFLYYKKFIKDQAPTEV